MESGRMITAGRHLDVKVINAADLAVSWDGEPFAVLLSEPFGRFGWYPCDRAEAWLMVRDCGPDRVAIIAAA